MLSAISSIKSVLLRQQASETLKLLHTTATCDAARKGTREKARKKKVKVEVKKVGFIPHNQRDKKINLQRLNKHVDDSWKQIPTDDVYVGRYYRWPVYTVAEAIECHRETHHPSMYNEPKAPLNALIELNMQGEKATRFVDNFSRMAAIPHPFDHGEERKILVFTKENELVAEAREAGATIVGGVETIKDIKSGEIAHTDFQYVIAHVNILAELVSLRGLLKQRFPNTRNDTLGTNLSEMIAKFINGVYYSAVKDEYQQNFGLINTCIGTLDMDAAKLEENLKFLLSDINSVRPKREGKFITRVLLKSPPSVEQLKIDPFLYVPESYSKPKNAKPSTEEALVDEKENTNATEERAAASN